MVQVDVFWAYGWGASLAMAAGRQLKKEPKPLETKFFVASLLFLSLCWAPTGMLARLFGIHDHIARALGQEPPSTGAHIASYFIGIPLALAALWFIALRPRGVARKVLAPLSPRGAAATI